jgi:hypothetical protein
MLHTHPSSGVGTIGPLVAGVPNGLSLIPPHELKKINISNNYAYIRIISVVTSILKMEAAYSAENTRYQNPEDHVAKEHGYLREVWL